MAEVDQPPLATRKDLARFDKRMAANTALGPDRSLGKSTALVQTAFARSLGDTAQLPPGRKKLAG